MYIFYICKFKALPEIMKLGVSIAPNNMRVRKHLETWGELSEDSIWYRLPSLYHLYQLERTIKGIFKPSRDKNKMLLDQKDGYTEFISIEHFEKLKDFISAYPCIDVSEDYKKIEGPFTFEFLIKNDFIKKNDIDILSEELGSHIKNLRLQENIQQSELALILEVSVPTIRKLENGENVTLDIFLSVLFYFNKLDWIYSLSNYDDLTKLHKRVKAKNNCS